MKKTRKSSHSDDEVSGLDMTRYNKHILNMHVYVFIFAGLTILAVIAVLIMREDRSGNDYQVEQQQSIEDAVANALLAERERAKLFASQTPQKELEEYQAQIEAAEESGNDLEKFSAYAYAAVAAKRAQESELAKEYAQKALNLKDAIPDDVRYLQKGLLQSLEEILNA